MYLHLLILNLTLVIIIVYTVMSNVMLKVSVWYVSLSVLCMVLGIIIKGGGYVNKISHVFPVWRRKAPEHSQVSCKLMC